MYAVDSRQVGSPPGTRCSRPPTIRPGRRAEAAEAAPARAPRRPRCSTSTRWSTCVAAAGSAPRPRCSAARWRSSRCFRIDRRQGRHAREGPDLCAALSAGSRSSRSRRRGSARSTSGWPTSPTPTGRGQLAERLAERWPTAWTAARSGAASRRGPRRPRRPGHDRRVRRPARPRLNTSLRPPTSRPPRGGSPQAGCDGGCGRPPLLGSWHAQPFHPGRAPRPPRRRFTCWARSWRPRAARARHQHTRIHEAAPDPEPQPASLVPRAGPARLTAPDDPGA